MSLKLVNKQTGQLVLEETDNGQLTIHDPVYREQYQKAVALEETTNNPTPKTDDEARKQLLLKAHEKLHAAYHKNPNNILATKHTEIAAAFEQLGLKHTYQDSLDDFKAEKNEN